MTERQPNVRSKLRSRRRRIWHESLEPRHLLTSYVDFHGGWQEPPKDDVAVIVAGETARIDLLANDISLMYHRSRHWRYPIWDDLLIETLPTVDQHLTVSPPISSGPIQVDSVSDPSHGSFQLLADLRTLIYTPEAGFVGIDQFSYVGLDGSGNSYEAKITIHVAEPIVAVPDWFHIEQHQTEVVLDVLANDGANIDRLEKGFGVEIKITLVETPPEGGSVRVSEDGKSLIYTPGGQFSGLETLNYTIEDANGFSTSTFVDVRVTGTGQFDTSGWSEWWKHQVISKSLDNDGFGNQQDDLTWLHYIDLIPSIAATLDLDQLSLSSRQASAVVLQTTDQASLEFSTTNVQVAGVDEGDLIKTDGNYIYLIERSNLVGLSRLLILDATDPNSLPLVAETEIEGTPLELHLLGDSLLLVSQRNSDVVAVTLDLTDRAAPTVQGESVVPGVFRESRSVDGVVQIYTSLASSKFTVLLGSHCADDGKTCFNETRQQLIDRILQDDSLTKPPSVDRYDSAGQLVDSIPLRPHVHLVLDDSLLVGTVFDGTDSVGHVLGEAEGAIIYSTGSSVYVFQRSDWPDVWIDVNTRAIPTLPGDSQTEVDHFHLNGNGLRWQASGEFQGHLLNSHSVGHHDDYLYVATTSNDLANTVTVLQQQDRRITTIGQTETLAPGESIYAARFVDDRAYVVTFRQIDPLFVIDLSDPLQPAVTAELKMPGYSQYLYPASEDLLIGVGRETNHWGEILGTEISLFDIRDPTAPSVIEKLPLGQMSLPLAENLTNLTDHRAFSYFASHQILALPVHHRHWWGHHQKGSSVMLYDISLEGGIEEAGRIDFGQSHVQRTLRIGDVIYSVSDSEIQAHDLNDLSAALINKTLSDYSSTDSAATNQQETKSKEPSSPNRTIPDPLETLVRIAPHFVGGDGQPIETAAVGQTVWIEFTAADVRAMQQLGVFSTYFDVDFGGAEVEIVGDSEFSDAFWVLRFDPADRGWNNIGATQGISSQTDPQRPWVLRTPVQFSSPGEVTVQVSPGDDQTDGTLMYGLDDPIPITAIDWLSDAITITDPAVDSMDVSGDGLVTLIDPLMVINRLIDGNEAAALSSADSEDRYDINKDGNLTAADALTLINYVDNQQQRAQAIAEVLEEEEEKETNTEFDSMLF